MSHPRIIPFSAVICTIATPRVMRVSPLAFSTTLLATGIASLAFLSASSCFEVSTAFVPARVISPRLVVLATYFVHTTQPSLDCFIFRTGNIDSRAGWVVSGVRVFCGVQGNCGVGCGFPAKCVLYFVRFDPWKLGRTSRYLVTLRFASFWRIHPPLFCCSPASQREISGTSVLFVPNATL